jgi:glycosyltransferase involved in cell wall biosynthesis
MGIEVLYGQHYQTNIHNWIRDNGDYFNFVFAHRMHIAPKYFQSLKMYTSAKIIYIGHDLQYLSSKRKFEITGDKNHQKDSEKFRKMETFIFNTVDMILPFSTYEAPFIRKIVPDKKVEPVPVYFYENNFSTQHSFSERKDILFVGGFGHPPNIDGLRWLVNEIFPFVLKSLPDSRLIVVGSNPTDEIKAMAGENIEIAGYVTDDQLENYYQSCRIAVLPLRYGAGVKGKLLEALYYGLPAVITPVAAEGVPEIENCTLISDKPVQFAEKISQLYLNEKEWIRCSQKGRDLIRKYYSEKTARNILEKLLV